MKKDEPTPPAPTPEDVDRCLAVLRAVAGLPDEHPVRQQVERAATQVQRGMKKRLRRERHRATSAADRATLDTLKAARHEERGVRALPASTEPSAHTARTRRCYVCKQGFTRLHPVYLSLCPDCAELNASRRAQHVSLDGRRALVTGGRIKVGFHVALRLLRDGAHVHVTSRFPHDAALRFSREPDFATWRERLVLHELDLRFPQRVLSFAQHLCATEPHLDILINNAAQTVRLTPEQGRALLAAERELARTLDAPARARVHALPEDAGPSSTGQVRALGLPGGLPLAPEATPAHDNAWVQRLEEVSPVEVLEAQLVNAIAPFLLNGHLKPLLLRSPFADRYIVNVSAVEGQFERRGGKTPFHPHTNMAKAALNMMTRTSAGDYARDGIYMNSVDPGWISNENPDARRRHMEEEGFSPPLDGADAAARVVDPILQGLQGRPVHGRFLKDFREAPW
jgi:NAD(P)-dependent dehydrogenase (short-subunit alcohol dehydrogenase family)